MSFKNYSNEAITLLLDLIRIPSYSKEEKQAADHLQNFIESKGVTTARKGNNVWCVSPGLSLKKPTILLNSHIDTVKPISGWRKRPHEPKSVNDKIFGLGSNDAGGSLVSLLQLFFLLTSKEQPYNLIFLASAEEEISGLQGISSVLPELPPISFGVVGEPTGMQPAIAERGLMVVDVKIRGKAGHAAREEGDNAIYKALKSIEWIKNFRFEKKSELLGEVKMTTTQINSGTQHNIVPDLCELVIDIRSNERYSNEEIFETIKSNCEGEVEARSFRLKPSATPLDHPFILRAKELGLTPFGSSTLSDQALMDFPSVKIGPGSSARSHTADEYIKRSEIEEAIERYYLLLNDLSI